MENPFIHPIIIRLENLEIAVKKLICSISNSENKFIEPKIVDLNGLLKYRPIVGKKSSVYKLVHEGRLPYHKPIGSKNLYFLLEEIDNYLLGKKSKSSVEIQRDTEKFLAA